MATELVKELINAGVHFGHRTSRWNPKMERYIYGQRNLIHIIDVKETLRGLLLAKKFLARVVGEGKDVLFVGTKRQARKAVEQAAAGVNMHWVTERWLGGTLTNFREIRKRITRLEELEQIEADGELDKYSKKQGAVLRRQMRKIRRNLGGIRNMNSLPGVMVVIDQEREIIAIREARKLKIPVICLLDTNGDPDMVDIPIPGNDDATRPVELIVNELAKAVQEGVAGRGEAEEESEKPRRRSRRPTTARAEPAPQAPTTPQEAPAAQQETAGEQKPDENQPENQTETPDEKQQPTSIQSEQS